MTRKLHVWVEANGATHHSTFELPTIPIEEMDASKDNASYHYDNLLDKSTSIQISLISDFESDEEREKNKTFQVKAFMSPVSGEITF